MATQTITYMNALAEHAAALRAHPQSVGAYQRIIAEGRVLPPETRWPTLDNKGLDGLRRQMEAIIERPCTSAEE